MIGIFLAWLSSRYILSVLALTAWLEAAISLLLRTHGTVQSSVDSLPDEVKGCKLEPCHLIHAPIQSARQLLLRLLRLYALQRSDTVSGELTHPNLLADNEEWSSLLHQ